MKSSFYMQITANYWAWSPTSGHCQLYQSLKKFGKRFSSVLNQDLGEKSPARTLSPNGTVSSKHFKKKIKSKTKYCIRCESRSTLNSSFCYNTDKHKRTITIEEANNLIWKNELNIGINSSSIIKCETNQLPANNPNEDQLFISKSPFRNYLMFGVLDGHGGCALGNITKTYLPYYLHLAVEDKQNVIEILKNKTNFEIENLLFDGKLSSVKKRWNNHINDFALEIINSDTFVSEKDNILSYISKNMNEIISDDPQYKILEDIDIVSAIRNAFIKYDSDLTNEVKHLAENGLLNSENVNIAMSGCCALVAYIMDKELFIANSGDCRAILGSYDNGNWSTMQLSNDHTAASNPSEVSRILSEHPIDEGRTCIQYGRLLGRLAPLRAFGDIQFKLRSEELNKILAGIPKYKPMSSLKTPPYLTAEPEIFHYQLESNDKFIVLASDGLWDMLSNEEVVELVSAYQQGNAISVLKERAHMFGVPNSDEIIENPDAFSDTANENVASFLIRCALGGFDVENLRTMLALKSPEVRFFRDDISVIVIFLDNNQIEHHSASQSNCNIE